jgi:hypothetical protein
MVAFLFIALTDRVAARATDPALKGTRPTLNGRMSTRCRL